MEYRTYKPNPILRDYVQCYWTMILDAAENIFPPRGYADGCMNIIFSFADPLRLNLSGNGYVENALPASIYGNVKKFVDFKVAGRLNLFSVHFKPGGIFPFVEIPLFELTNRFVDANFISTRIGSDLFEKLAQQKDTASRIRIVEQALIAKLRSFINDDKIIKSSVNRIMQLHGNLGVDLIARETGISTRQLERRFKTRVGIGPKELCQILRFRHVQYVLKHSGKKSLLAIAFENGYFDHAHLTNDFKRLAGVSPSYYAENIPYF